MPNYECGDCELDFTVDGIVNNCVDNNCRSDNIKEVK